jgi:hypothetical protein
LQVAVSELTLVYKRNQTTIAIVQKKRKKK